MKGRMQAGELNSWGVIEKPIGQPGAAADVAALEWQPVTGCWAKLRATGGIELAVADQLENRSWWEITIRYRSGIDATMRFRIGQAIWNFTNVVDAEISLTALTITAWQGKGMN